LGTKLTVQGAATPTYKLPHFNKERKTEERWQKSIMCSFVPMSLYMPITVYIPLVYCNKPVVLKSHKKYLSADEERPNQNTNC
jgi:hypothetical protein